MYVSEVDDLEQRRMLSKSRALGNSRRAAISSSLRGGSQKFAERAWKTGIHQTLEIESLTPLVKACFLHYSLHLCIRRR